MSDVPVYTHCSSIREELDNLRSKFPKLTIHSSTLAFVTWSYERTPSARLKATLTFPDGAYPSRRNLVCDVSWVPPGLKKKLERHVTGLLQATDVVHSYQQVEATVQYLTQVVDTNLFVPCWKEVRQVVDRIQREENSTVQMNDTKGLLVLRLQNAECEYYYACTIRIHPAYPSTFTPKEWGQACKLTLKATNLPSKIEAMLTSQAQELVRRMQDGMSAEDALRMSNPIEAPSRIADDDDDESGNHDPVPLSQKALKGLKHDIETLAHVRDLRDVNAATRQGNATVKSHTAKERKDARRAIGKITKQELQNDTREEEEWQRQEQERMAGYHLPEGDTSPQPSLLSLVTFLQNRIQRLPGEICPVCQKRTLPEHPDELQALYDKAHASLSEKQKKERRQARRKRPVRTYCGCWYHWACLDKFMTEPPFGAKCPAPHCGRRVYHPDWPASIKELERGWANRQARQREIEDAAMFL